MKLIISEIDKLKTNIQFTTIIEFKDQMTNEYYNNWVFLAENLINIINTTDYTEQDVLYSKYYWCTRFLNRYHMIYGNDAGFDQQQFQIYEEIEMNLGSIDWNLIQELDQSLSGNE